MAEEVCPHTSVIPGKGTGRVHGRPRWLLDETNGSIADKGIFRCSDPVYAFHMRSRGLGAQTGDAMIKIKKAMICAFSALLVALSAGVAGAQTDYPNRPIHFIVGFAAGGGNDLFARLVVQKFQENTGATA